MHFSTHSEVKVFHIFDAGVHFFCHRDTRLVLKFGYLIGRTRFPQDLHRHDILDHQGGGILIEEEGKLSINIKLIKTDHEILIT